MAQAKKGKKNKGKTLALSDFLQETPGPIQTMPIRKTSMNWADDVEDSHDAYDSRAAKTNVVLPTAPKASRDFDDIIDKVPTDPPYIAYLTNLPYDVDENEISYLFKNMKVTNMRIPKDERPGEPPKLRGFGYVEFEDRESLLNALVIPDVTIKSRRIRIGIATDYENDKRRPGRMDMRGEQRGGRSEISMGDWRSGPRQEQRQDNNDRGFSRDRDHRAESSSEAAGAWRSGARFRDDRERDDKYSSRGPPSRNGGGFSRNRDEGGGGGASEGRSNEPKQRQKLVLAPRTKPVENEQERSSSAAIFGNAKPVDTSARERQIEERLARDKDDVVPKREASRERREVVLEREPAVHRERKESEEEAAAAAAAEEENIEGERKPKSDVNGVTDKSHPPQKAHEKREKEAPVKPEKKREERKDNKGDSKEMPQLKKADPPNFSSSNKYAFLMDDNSD